MKSHVATPEELEQFNLTPKHRKKSGVRELIEKLEPGEAAIIYKTEYNNLTRGIRELCTRIEKATNRKFELSEDKAKGVMVVKRVE